VFGLFIHFCVRALYVQTRFFEVRVLYTPPGAPAPAHASGSTLAPPVSPGGLPPTPTSAASANASPSSISFGPLSPSASSYLVSESSVCWLVFQTALNATLACQCASLPTSAPSHTSPPPPPHIPLHPSSSHHSSSSHTHTPHFSPMLWHSPFNLVQRALQIQLIRNRLMVLPPAPSAREPTSDPQLAALLSLF
jgi:hypothetical protein